jgi:hypothetical protein
VRPQVIFVRGVWGGYRRSANGSLRPSTILHNDAYPRHYMSKLALLSRCRLKHYRREMIRREPPRRGNARGASPDDRDVHVSGHLLHT